jgi:Phage tail fibre repeat.
MGSTNKFSSGLNNWVDSDKPERIDFVTDNEIIDENAMWKDDYDPNGTIAAAGGIEQAVQSAVTTIAGGKAPNNHAASTSVHGAASTTDWGHVRLVNSVSSTSTTDVPVAANVKAVNDVANNLTTRLNNAGIAMGNAKVVTNLNDVMDNGWYRGSSPANAPTTGPCIVNTVTYDANFAIQYWHLHTEAANATPQFRTRHMGTWSPWYKVRPYIYVSGGNGYINT